MGGGSGGGGKSGRGGGAAEDVQQPGEVFRAANALQTKADIRNAMKVTDTLYNGALEKYGWANAQRNMPEAERQGYHQAVKDLRTQKNKLREALKSARE